MATRTDPRLPGLRLLQLVSPSLPVGAFSYSQGLEWAVQAGWLKDAETLHEWLDSTLQGAVVRNDLPLLERLYRAVERGDVESFSRWTDEWLAWRETAELRAEETQKGRALATLLRDLDTTDHSRFNGDLRRSFLSGFAYAAACWSIPLQSAAEAYLWGWLENQVLSAVKLIPLGQTSGQTTLYRLAESLPALAATGLALSDSEIGSSTSALAIASSRHETQYTRLYRS